GSKPGSKTTSGDNTPQYPVTMYLPGHDDPATEDEAKVERIRTLNREMIAAGVRKFACAALHNVHSPRRSTLVAAFRRLP
ncbi:MAG: hypothetical protein ACLGP3_12340, partial [Acidobacteriota bacterium]